MLLIHPVVDKLVLIMYLAPIKLSANKCFMVTKRATE